MKDNDIKKMEKAIDCSNNLCATIQEAGGSVRSIMGRDKDMSLREFITDIAGTNNIRFFHDKNQNTKDKI